MVRSSRRGHPRTASWSGVRRFRARAAGRSAGPGRRAHARLAGLIEAQEWRARRTVQTAPALAADLLSRLSAPALEQASGETVPRLAVRRIARFATRVLQTVMH